MFERIGRWCLLATLWAFCSLAGAQTTRINVGYVPAGDWLPAMVAKDKGFFEKRQLDVTLTKVALISNMPPAILSGSLDIGASTPPALIDAAEAGLGLLGIAGGTRFVKDPAIFSLVARTGVKIEGPKDLIGKRVGVPGLRSVGDVLLRKWLLDKGVDPAKVTFIEAPFPQMKDLLKGGTLDAVAVLDPIRSRIVSDNTGYRVADYVYEVQPDLLGSVWIGRKEWLTANAKAVQAFKEALAEAIAFIGAQRDEARAIELKYLGFNTPVLLPYNLALSPNDLETYESIGKAVGYLRKPVDAGKLIFR